MKVHDSPLSKMILIIHQSSDNGNDESWFNPHNPSGGVKKLVACASAHMDECLVEALERGSLDVMGNLRFR